MVGFISHLIATQGIATTGLIDICVMNREQYYKSEEELKKMKKPMYVQSLFLTNSKQALMLM